MSEFVMLVTWCIKQPFFRRNTRKRELSATNILKYFSSLDVWSQLQIHMTFIYFLGVFFIN
jgi:hypothetical protein